MNYELYKKLKDAGFIISRRIEAKNVLVNGKKVYGEEVEKALFSGYPFIILEDIIDQLPKQIMRKEIIYNFAIQYRLLDGETKNWWAGYCLRDGSAIESATGETLVEAVAQLWLDVK